MEIRFSKLAEQLKGTKNPLYTLHEDLKSSATAITDLVRGNVNEHGMVYPQEELQQILSNAIAKADVYRPEAFGQLVARQTIAAFYRDLRVSPDQLLLTPGTSVAYWYCFKLLAEPGDEILSPQPSYPLFDYIAQLSGVHMTHYRLVEARDWKIDLDYLEAQITTRTRAIILISPHNPTGMVIDKAQLDGIAGIARRHALPIIADEVFSEFLFGLDRLPRIAETNAPLVFTLNGFSKMFALPGMKIGWMLITGDPAMVKRSQSALEMISDTFLPVNEVAQFAVPEIFARGKPFLERYRAWVHQCYERAIGGLADVQLVRPQGGFYLTIPTADEEEKVAMELLRNHGILTHPGYYYDIKPDHLVMTFIHDPQTLTKSFRRVAMAVKGT